MGSNKEIHSMKCTLSAGMVVIKDRRILLVHPTNASWWNTYSIPKGRVEPRESPFDAALRECEEETGIKIIKNESLGCCGELISANGKRRVLYYLVYLKRDVKVKLNCPEEVNWAGFVSWEQAQKRILPMFKPLLEYINPRIYDERNNVGEPQSKQRNVRRKK